MYTMHKQQLIYASWFCFNNNAFLFYCAKKYCGDICFTCSVVVPYETSGNLSRCIHFGDSALLLASDGAGTELGLTARPSEANALP